MRRNVLAIGAAAMLAGAGAAAAVAQTKAKAGAVTGVDKIHTQVSVGGKTCFVDHEHTGEGEMATRAGAEGAAVRKWQVFTADEYGSAWGSYKLAVSKRMTCKEGGGRWSCVAAARPCRAGKS